MYSQLISLAVCLSVCMFLVGCETPTAMGQNHLEAAPTDVHSNLPGELLGGPANLSSYQPASPGRIPAIYGPRVKFGQIGGVVE